MIKNRNVGVEEVMLPGCWWAGVAAWCWSVIANFYDVARQGFVEYNISSPDIGNFPDAGDFISR